MRPLLLLPMLILPLAGCDAFWGPFAAANVASLTTTGRAVPDLFVSAVTGKDCSIAHLDAGEKRYCRRDPLPPVEAVCTRVTMSPKGSGQLSTSATSRRPPPRARTRPGRSR